MSKLRLVCLSIMLMIVSLQGKATDFTPNLKFGNPTREELAMTTYDADTSAVAVMLCSITDVSYYVGKNSLESKSKIKKRIKILKSEGQCYGNISIDDSGVVTDIKATSWNMVDGKIVKKELDSKDIHDESDGDMDKHYTFTAPMANVGAVIEYEYTVTRTFIPKRSTWYANVTIPVLYTKYKLEFIESVIVNPVLAGSYPLECKKSKGVFTNYPTNIWIYEGRDLPAVKSEEYSWCPSQYASHVDLFVMGTKYQSYKIHNDKMSWKAADEEYAESGWFRKWLHIKNPFGTEMKALGIYDMKSSKEQIEACANLLFSKVKWNNVYSNYNNTGKLARDVIASGTGSNAEMNFLMIGMLKDLGIDAVPVLLRLRQNGRLPAFCPYLDPMDTFVVGIMGDDGKMYYFDGSARYGYLNVLPPELLVEGHPFGNNDGVNEMVSIVSAAEAGCNAAVEAWVDTDEKRGKVKLRMDLKYKYMGLLSMYMKEYYDGFKGNNSAYVDTFSKKISCDIFDYSNEGANMFGPSFTEKFSIVHEFDGGELFDIFPLNRLPDFMPALHEDERDIPVDFDSRKSLSYSFILHIPQGYSVKRLPQNATYRTNSNDVVLKLVSAVSDNCVILKMNFSIKKNLFMPDEYKGLKDILDIYYSWYKEQGCSIELVKN